MKGKLSILLVVSYLLSTTHLGELLKLPVLAIHFMEHHHEESKLSFWNFLSSHYGYDESKNNKHEDDCKLPFKSQCCNNLAAFSFYIPAPNFSFMLNPILIKDQTILHRYSFAYSLKVFASIWHPPKIS